MSEEEKKELEEKAKDAEEETPEEKKAREEKEKAEAKDAEGDEKIAALEAKVDKLIGIVEQLVASDKEVHESIDKMCKDAEEEEEAEKARMAEEEEKAKDAEEEEEKKEEEYASEEEEKEETTDAAFRAEVLVPGTKLPKLTTKKRKAVDGFKRKTLTKAYAMNENVKKTVDSIILKGDKNFSKMPKQTIDTLFLATSEVLIASNNGKVQSKAMDSKSMFKVTNEIEQINKKNKEFWNKAKVA
jgi:hypothetical protein